jgi:hypothetical protein
LESSLLDNGVVMPRPKKFILEKTFHMCFRCQEKTPYLKKMQMFIEIERCDFCGATGRPTRKVQNVPKEVSDGPRADARDVSRPSELG